MNTFVPIVIYRLPGDLSWTADAIGLDGAHAEGDTISEAERNLTACLKEYIEMLNPDDPMQVAELDYLARLISPPEGVQWIVMPMSARLETIVEA